MRWWMAIRPRSMAIDNAGVTGMDYTILPSNTSFVEWKDGRGEAEYNDRPGLRENFHDVIFYAPLFQQFMTLLTAITLGQSKKVQTDLITSIFDSKRQAPFSYTISTGTFQWDATDSELISLTALAVAGTAGGVNSTNSQLASLVAQINSNIVAPAQNNYGSFVGFQAYLNENILGAWTGDPDAANTINNRLTIISGMLGLSDNLPHPAYPYYNASGVSISGGAGTTYPWTPIGATTPQNLTAAELVGLISGITTRRQNLQNVSKSKQAAVNALTTVAAVIAYDVTTGWP